MKIKRVAVIAIVALVAVILISALWPRTPVDSASLNFRLKWLWYSGWAGELMAEHEGYWAARGLAVVTRPGGFELDPIKLVASGEDEVGVAGADQILLARMNGVPLVAFAVQYQQSPVGFVSMKESAIRSVADFRGKRIGVKYGTDVEPVYRALMSKAGLTKDDVTEVPVKFDLAPFFSGAIDVYPGYLSNDLLLPEEKGYAVNVISAPDQGVSVYGNVYFCREDFLRDHPQELVAFLLGVGTGWAKALESSPEQIADLALAKNSGLNRDHEMRAVESLRQYIIPQGRSFGSMTDEGWACLYTLLHEQGVIDRPFDYRAAYSMDILNRLPHAN